MVDVQTTGTSVVPPASTTKTTSSPPPTTTTTSAAPTALPADRTQAEGYLDPPLQNSGVFVVNGSGPTEVSVLWSTPDLPHHDGELSRRQPDRRRHDGDADVVA